MTTKEFDKLRQWNFGKKPIKGYIYLYPESAKYFSFISEHDKECIYKDKQFYSYPDDLGFKINEDSISFKTRTFTGIPSIKVTVPYKYIMKVRLHNYNY